MKKIKFLFFAFLTGLTIVSCSDSEVAMSETQESQKFIPKNLKETEEIEKEGFLRNVALLYGPRLKYTDDDTQNAISFYLISYNDYKLRDSYVIEGVEYTDDGNYNDRVAGDGLFTSITTLPDTDFEVVADDINHLVINEDFFDTKTLYTDLGKGKKPAVRYESVTETSSSIECFFHSTNKGSSPLGIPCDVVVCFEFGCAGKVAAKNFTKVVVGGNK